MVILLYKKSCDKNKLYDDEIANIIKVYNETGSIKKTAKLTKHSHNTVNKYVKEISSLKPNSRYNARKVIKMIPETLQIVKEYQNTRIACIVEHIERTNMNKALTGKILTAGGFIWAYKGEEHTKRPVAKYFVSKVRQEDILLGLK